MLVKMEVLFKVLCISFLGISTAIAMEMDPDDVANSTYHSLAELKQKASTSKIKFIHNLSEFTYSKMEPGMLGSFSNQGRLVDKDSTPAPGVHVVEDFAVDTKSIIHDGEFDGVRWGHNTKTGEFLAFKTVRKKTNRTEACNSEEAEWLKYFEKFRGVIPHFEEPRFSYLIMPLIDGLNFTEFKDKGLFGKINSHARYLVAYNLLEAFKDFKEKSVVQVDKNPANFMLSAANFDVIIVDFGHLRKTDETGILPSACFQTSMLGDLFLADDEGKVSTNIHDIKKYERGTFKNFVEFIRNKVEEKCDFIYVDDIINVFPLLP